MLEAELRKDDKEPSAHGGKARACGGKAIRIGGRRLRLSGGAGWKPGGAIRGVVGGGSS